MSAKPPAKARKRSIAAKSWIYRVACWRKWRAADIAAGEIGEHLEKLFSKIFMRAADLLAARADSPDTKQPEPIDTYRG
jgi:hypothetical protein